MPEIEHNKFVIYNHGIHVHSKIFEGKISIENKNSFGASISLTPAQLPHDDLDTILDVDRILNKLPFVVRL